MTDLNATQALIELAAMTNPTVNDLRALVAQLDISTPPGTTAVLYSKTLADLGSGVTVSGRNVALAMSQNSAALSVIDDTQASIFLSSPEFRQALLNATGGDAGARDALLFSADGGFWSNASERFADAATGNVISVNSFADPAAPISVFAGVELPTLLSKSDADLVGRTIDGIPLIELKQRFNANLAGGMSADDAARDIADIVSGRSLSNAWHNVEVGKNPSTGEIAVKVSDDFFTNSGVNGVGEIDTAGSLPTRQIAEVHPGFSSDDFARLGRSHNFINGLKVAGKYAGPVGDLLELAVRAVVVKELLEQGDRVGAAREVSEFGGSLAGGTLAAAGAAKVAAPLLAGGPVGWAAYLLVVGAAGYAGSELGEEGAGRLFDSIEGTFDGGGLVITIRGDRNAYWRASMEQFEERLAEGLGYVDAFALTAFDRRWEYSDALSQWVRDGNEGLPPIIVEAYEEINEDFNNIVNSLTPEQFDVFERTGRLPSR